MLRVTQKEWEDFKRHNNPEVFTEEQMGLWVEAAKETLIKSEVDELNDIEKAEVENFKSELQSFIKVEVVGQNSDPLIKGLSYKTFYTRPQQIIWDADEIVKSEDGKEEIQKSKGGIYADTAQNRKMGRVGQRFGGSKQEEGTHYAAERDMLKEQEKYKEKQPDGRSKNKAKEEEENVPEGVNPEKWKTATKEEKKFLTRGIKGSIAEKNFLKEKQNKSK